MLKMFKSKDSDFMCPMSGKIISIKDVNDPVFAKEMMGTGFAIIPSSSGDVISPIDGEIIAVFPTGHAYGIKGTSGLEIIIHIGIDTVTLDGKGFEVLCEQGQRIKAGEKLCCVDIQVIKEQKKDPTCIVVFPNKEEIRIKNVSAEVSQGTQNIIGIK